jgi:hypothetical protein
MDFGLSLFVSKLIKRIFTLSSLKIVSIHSSQRTECCRITENGFVLLPTSATLRHAVEGYFDLCSL